MRLGQRDTELLTVSGFSMPAADDSREGMNYTPTDQLRHDLKTPLTTIYSRAYLLGRRIRRSPTLSEEERVAMLAGLAVIEASVQEMVVVIDVIGHDPRDGHRDRTGPASPGDEGRGRGGGSPPC